jgi:serine/threonine protein kinase
MGRVWLARDEVLHRDVAVKEVVPPSGLTESEGEEASERGLREARAIARLNHPNVVRIYDVVARPRRPWIVMEYVRSRSLQERIAADGPLPVPEVARIGLDILSALHAAHRAGVLHRDVKPSNVLIADDGRVVLTDFGLATLAGDATLTRSGLILGSPAYIAPERARQGTTGTESDLWSLGATLFAAVEGRAPYHRSTAMATLTALVTEPPDPTMLAGPLVPVLDGLLDKNPATRMTAPQAAHALRRLLGSLRRVGEQPRRLPRERRPSGRPSLGSLPPAQPHRPAMPAQPVPAQPQRPAVGRAQAPARPTWPAVGRAQPPIRPAEPPVQRTPVQRPAVGRAQPPAPPREQPPATSREQPPAPARDQPPTWPPIPVSPLAGGTADARPGDARPAADAPAPTGPAPSTAPQVPAASTAPTVAAQPDAPAEPDPATSPAAGTTPGKPAAQESAVVEPAAESSEASAAAEPEVTEPSVAPAAVEPGAVGASSADKASPTAGPAAESSGAGGVAPGDGGVPAGVGSSVVESEPDERFAAESRRSAIESTSDSMGLWPMAEPWQGEPEPAKSSSAATEPAAPPSAGTELAASSSAATESAASSSAETEPAAGASTDDGSPGDEPAGNEPSTSGPADREPIAGEDAASENGAPGDTAPGDTASGDTASGDSASGAIAIGESTSEDTPSEDTEPEHTPSADTAYETAATEHNATEHNATEHNATEHNAPEHNATEHGGSGDTGSVPAGPIAASPIAAGPRGAGLVPPRILQGGPVTGRRPYVRVSPPAAESTRKLMFAALCVLVTVVIVAVLVGIGLRPSHPSGTAAPSPGSHPARVLPATPAPTSPPGTLAPSVTVSSRSAQRSVPPSPAGTGLPAGWHMYRDPTGFSVAVPDGWTLSHSGTIVYFHDPVGGRLLGVDQTNQPKSDPVADWTSQSRYRVSHGDFPGYQQIKIAAVPYHLKAADWEFTYDKDGVRTHVINRGAVFGPHQAYGFYWSTPDSVWAANLPNFELIMATFQGRT